jgi:hypothetical protein
MKGDVMISTILSLIFGALSLLGPVPVVLPIIGLGLGANAAIKESRKPNKAKYLLWMSGIAIVVNAFVATMFVVKTFVK